MVEIIRKPMSNRVKDITGEKFGRLTVIEYIGSNKVGDAFWKCKCECGNIIEVLGGSLRNGNTQSCGCLALEAFYRTIQKHRDQRALLPPKPPKEKDPRWHGMKHTRIWRIWASMKNRCNPNHKNPSRYVKNGISVCDEWKDFKIFYKWAIENGYRDDLTIDRIDPTKNYCPENCRWLNKQDQSNNRTDNHYIYLNLGFRDLVFTATEWSRISHVKASAILGRLNHGWNEFDAIFTPSHCKPGEKVILPTIPPEMLELNHIDYFNSVGRINHLAKAKNTKKKKIMSYQRKQVIMRADFY